MSKGNDKKIFMSTEEKNLIMNSMVSERYPKLKEVLSNFKKGIDKNDLLKIQKMDEEVYKLIKTRDAVITMKDDSSIEWMQKEFKGKIKIPCELCGNTNSQDKYVIINRINKNELKVGSNCIFKFSKMDSKLYGLPIKQIANLHKNNPEKLKRIVKFNELYPRGKNIFNDWQDKYNSFDILLPKDYDEEFTELLRKGREIYNLYVSEKLSDDKLSSFQGIIEDFDYFYKYKCAKFYNENYKDKYQCSKNIASLLENSGLKGTLEYIRQTGKIKNDIAKHIYH